jgi:hypothetical protein
VAGGLSVAIEVQLHLFLISAPDGRVQSNAFLRPLYCSGKESPVEIEYDACWAPQ